MYNWRSFYGIDQITVQKEDMKINIPNIAKRGLSHPFDLSDICDLIDFSDAA